jgi:hypothetical protein
VDPNADDSEHGRLSSCARKHYDMVRGHGRPDRLGTLVGQRLNPHDVRELPIDDQGLGKVDLTVI